MADGNQQCCFSAFHVEWEAEKNGDARVPSMYSRIYINRASFTWRAFYWIRCRNMGFSNSTRFFYLFSYLWIVYHLSSIFVKITLVNAVCSISFVYSFSNSSWAGADILLCTSIRSNKHISVHRNLLCYWVVNGNTIFLTSLLSVHISSSWSLHNFNHDKCALCLTGYEYKGNWNCDWTHNRGLKPSRIFSDMGFCNGCNYLYHPAIELFKHG